MLIVISIINSDTDPNPPVQGNPVCRCLPGFVPMPDTIQGCKHECEVDRDCGAGNICDNYRSQVIPALVLSNTHCCLLQVRPQAGPV